MTRSGIRGPGVRLPDPGAYRIPDYRIPDYRIPAYRIPESITSNT
jgi:hypothetical protein